MGLLKGLLRARKLLLIILVPLLLLPLPVLHPSSVSTGLSPRPHLLGPVEGVGCLPSSAWFSVGGKKWKCFPGGG